MGIDSWLQTSLASKYVIDHSSAAYVENAQWATMIHNY